MAGNSLDTMGCGLHRSAISQIYVGMDIVAVTRIVSIIPDGGSTRMLMAMAQNERNPSNTVRNLRSCVYRVQPSQMHKMPIANITIPAPKLGHESCRTSNSWE